MRKQRNIFLLITSFLVVLCLFSHRLYAGALHFIAYGDTRRDSKTLEKPQVKHNAMAKVMRELNPDFILFTGDMVYRNEFEKFLEVITHNYMGNTMIPLYPAIGNHEVAVIDKLDGFVNELLKKLGITNKPKEQTSSSSDVPNDVETLRGKLYREIDSIVDGRLKARSRQVLCEEFKNQLNPAYSSYLSNILNGTTTGQSWYSFMKEIDGLGIKFIALNSSLPDDEEQFQWFLRELKQCSGPKIIFAHYPPYSIGHHGWANFVRGESREARFRDRYAKIFNDTANNIVFVISGHDHNYQRICKTDIRGGIQLPVYIVTGGGGADLTGQGDGDVSHIPLDGFHCLGLITAYHFMDVTACSDDKKNLIFKCTVLGLRCDLTRGLPDDDTFERQFIKDRLELIDDFTLNWQQLN